MNLRISINKTVAVAMTALLAIAFFAMAQTASAAGCSITLSQPTATSYHNGTITINWTDNGDTSCATTNVDFKYNSSTNDGGNFYTIASAPANTGAVGVTFDTTTTFSGDTVEDGTDYTIQADTGGAILDTTGPFTIDNTNPTITSTKTADSNLDGVVDKIVVTIDDGAVGSGMNTCDSAGWSVTDNDSGVTPITINSCTVDNATQVTLAITPTIGVDFQTDSTPAVQYTQGGSNNKDAAGNELASYGPTNATDDAAPVPLNAEIIDHNSDGLLDLVSVKFSEAMGAQIVSGDGENANATITGSDFGVIVGGSVVTDGNKQGTSDSSDLTLVSFNFTPTNKKTDVGDLAVTFATNASSKIEDATGNVTPSFTLTASGNTGLGSSAKIEDGAAPVITTREYLDNNGDGTVDFVKLVWSEDVDDSTITASDFEASLSNATPGAGDLTESFTSGTPSSGYETDTANDNTIYVGLASNGETIASNTTFYTNLYIQAVGSVNDLATTANSSVAETTGTSADDKARPVVIDTATVDRGTSPDGIVDTLELQFSEYINDSEFVTNAVNDWQLSSDGGTTWDYFDQFSEQVATLAVDNDPNDDYMKLYYSSVPMNITGTHQMKYKYSNDGGDDITDPAGNKLADISADDANDKAAPQIKELQYLDDNGDGKIDSVKLLFSEFVTASSFLSANDLVFTSVGDFTDMAFGTDGTDLLDPAWGGGGDVTITLGTPATPVDTRDDTVSITFDTQNAFSLQDSAGNINTATTVPAEITDKAAPVLLTADTSTKTVDNGAGKTSTMTLKYSEDVIANSSTITSDYTVAKNPATSIGSSSAQIDVSSVSVANDLVTLTLDLNDPDQSTTQMLLSYNVGTVKDWVNNQAVAESNSAIDDQAKPALVGFVANPNPAGIGDNLAFTLTFSERMNNGIALTGTTFDQSPSVGPYNTAVDSYTDQTWQGHYTNNPIVAGTPKTGNYTFGAPVASGVDLNGNAMVIPSSTNLSFLIDSVAPVSSGLEVTLPAGVSAFAPGVPVTITGTLNDDLKVTGGDLYINGNFEYSVQPADGTWDSTIENFTTTYTIPATTAPGTTFTVYVRAKDQANVEQEDANGDGTNDINTETFTTTTDSTAPTITINGTPTVTVNADTYYVSGSVSDTSFKLVKVFRMVGATPSGTNDVQIGTFAFGPTETNWSVLVQLPQNTTTKYYAEAFDAAGNYTPSAILSVVEDSTLGVDLTPPATPVITTTSTTVDADTYEISGTAGPDAPVDGPRMIKVMKGTETVGTVVLQAGETTWSIVAGLDQNTTNTFTAVSSDAFNNTSSASASVTITEQATPTDTTPPAGAVSTTAATVNADSYIIAGTLTADSDNVTITVNNGTADVGTTVVTAGNTSWSVTVPLPQSAATTFTVKASDAVPNTATLGSVVITEDSTLGVDSIAPVGLTITTSAATVDQDFYTIEGGLSADADEVTVQVLNGSTVVGTVVVPAGNTTWSVVVALPQSTATTFTARATDASGNVATGGSVTITEATPTTDTTAPWLSSTSPNTQQPSGSVAPVEFVFVDDNPFNTNAIQNVKEIVMDGASIYSNSNLSVAVLGSNKILTITYTDTNMPVGVHNFNVRIQDAAGNTREASMTVDVYDPADTTAPTIALTSPSVTAITQTGVSINFTSDEAGEAQVNYGTTNSYGNVTTWQTMSVGNNGITLGGLACGTTYNFQVAAKDASGNIATPTSNATFATSACSDTTAPDFNIGFSNVVTNGFDVQVLGATEQFDVLVEVDDNADFSSVDQTVAYTGGLTANTITRTVTGLNADTLYYVRVTLSDQVSGAGNTKSKIATQQTAQGGAVNLTGLSVSAVADTTAQIDWATDSTPASGDYRVSTTPYSGTWTAMTTSGTSGTQALTGLSANTTYYYQVRFTKNGQTSYSIPMSFTTAASGTGLLVTNISPISNANNGPVGYATADDSYANGWKWKFNITLNNLTETDLAMKFDQWVSGTNTLDAANNMRYSVDDATWTSITANGAYPATNIDVSAIDEDASKGGRQVTVYVEMKVPAGSAGGSYSAQYGVQSL